MTDSNAQTGSRDTNGTKPVQRILVRSPNWVGDVVMATPAFRCLRRNFPGAHISVLVKNYSRQVIEGGPWFDEVIEYDPEGAHRGVLGYLRLVRRLRRGRYDLAIVLVNSQRGALEALLSGARERVGYDRGGRGWTFTKRIPPPRENNRNVPINMVDYYLDLCYAVGCSEESRQTELFTTPEGEAQAEEILHSHGWEPSRMMIAINPGASFGSSKCWPPEYFASTADLLIERHNCQIIIFCAPKERAIAQAVASRMKHPVINPCGHGVTLHNLKAITRRCRMLITNDTGPRHYAVAFGLPVVCIMGSTSPRYTDVNLEKTTKVSVEVHCGPCQQKVCTQPEHICMTRVTPEMVLDAADDLLRRF